MKSRSVPFSRKLSQFRFLSKKLNQLLKDDQFQLLSQAKQKKLLNRLKEAGIRGELLNAKKGENLENYQLHVYSKSKGKKIQEYKVNPNGTYHLVLPEGDYKLELKNEKKEGVILKIGR